MKIVKDTTFEFGYVVSQIRPPAYSLTVVVKATFAMVREGDCTIADEQLPVNGESYLDEDAANSLRYDSDLAVLKPRGECYLVGTCHPPGGRPAGTCAVAMHVGSVNKSLAVFGNRYWRGSLPSEPERFATMPLHYERSFGGPGHRLNPVGIGTAEVNTAAGPRRHLPNIENPRALITEPASRPEPAGMFPFPPTWPQRASRTGSYNELWLKTRWPALPADFDYAYYNAAPADQQIQGYWRGDEDVGIQNLDATHAVMRMRLPGVRPRLFLDVAQSEQHEFREVTLNLDTIVVDADAQRVLCTWRGVTGVAGEKLTEIENVFIVHEPIATRRAHQEYQDWFEQKLGEDLAVLEEFEPEEPLADDPTVMLNVPGEAAPPANELEKRIAAMQAKLGVKPAPPGPAAAAAPKPPTVAEALAAFTAKGAKVPAALVELAAIATTAPVTLPPAESDELRKARMRQRVIDAHAAQESLRGEDLTGADLRELQLPGIDLTGAILQDANLRGANLEAAILDEAILTRAELVATVLRRASIKKADFSEVQAEHADFEGALIEASAFANAGLASANFRGANCSKSDFGAADLSHANLEDARFDGANLSNARLGRARFVRASLVSAALEGIDANEAVFDQADLTKANFAEGARLTDASFAEVVAPGSNWTGAVLNKANLSFGDFTRSNFSEASLVQARINGSELKAAVFRDAVLIGASVMKSNAHDANFERADLSHADLRGTNFFGAEFVHANTSFARLELANLKRTILA